MMTIHTYVQCKLNLMTRAGYPTRELRHSEGELDTKACDGGETRRIIFDWIGMLVFLFAWQRYEIVQHGYIYE